MESFNLDTDLVTFLDASLENQEMIAEHMSEKDVYHFVLSQKVEFLKKQSKWKNTNFAKKYFTYFINRSIQQKLDISTILKKYAKEHLTRLNLSKKATQQIKKLIGKLPICTYLEELDLTDCFSLDNHTLNALLKKVPNLKKLILANCHKITKITATFPQLQEVNFSSTSMTNEHLLDFFERAQNLKRCNLSYTTTIFQLKHFQLPSLEYLDLSMSAINEEGLKAFLNGCENLKELNCFHAKKLSGLAFFHLKQKLKLIKLNFAMLPITDKILSKVLEMAPCLEHLTLFSCLLITGQAFSEQTKPLVLKNLNLSQTGILDKHLYAIGLKCTQLRALHLVNCKVTLEKFIKSQKAFLLTELRVRQSNITNENLNILVTKSAKLEVLVLSNCSSLDATGLSSIKKLTKLKELDLRSVKNSQVFLDALGSFPNLKSWMI